MADLVSIIMPCYNAEMYLQEALDCVLKQTHRQLQVICINDGSTDATKKILKTNASKDARIEIHDQPTNRGLVASLNLGLSKVKGKYFARMDADDLCAPDRVSTQLNFLSNNRKCMLVSTGYEYQTGKGRIKVHPLATTSKALRFISVFSTPLNHAASMGRSELIRSGDYRYDATYAHAEDYELFSRLLSKGVVMANIPENLYVVRVHNRSVSHVYSQTQVQSNVRICRKNLATCFPDLVVPTSDEMIALATNHHLQSENFRQVADALRLLDICAAQYKATEDLAAKEKTEIERYLALQKTNVVLQSGKRTIERDLVSGLHFFARSIPKLSAGQWKVLFSKLIKRG